MYQVTDEQVAYILEDIKNRGIVIEDLQLSILDHICCIIECELSDGDDFKHFYQDNIKRFYKKELREIETETIQLLTFKNFYKMKKAMFISGAYSVVAFILGSYFKIMHWQGTSAFLVTAILVFSFIFLPLLFIMKTREGGTQRDKLILGLATLVGALYCLSALWNVMHWPGSRVLWLTMLCISFFVLLPIYFFTGIRKPETKINTIVATILMVGFLGVQFTLTAMRRPQPPQEQVCAAK